MCLLLTGGAGAVIIVDGKGWDELGARRDRTVDEVFGHVFQGSVAEPAQLFVVQDPQRRAWGNDVPTASGWIQLFVLDSPEDHLPRAVKAKAVATGAQKHATGLELLYARHTFGDHGGRLLGRWPRRRTFAGVAFLCQIQAVREIPQYNEQTVVGHRIVKV